MYHGIILNGINTLDEYGLLLLADLKIGAAQLKENYVNVPGGDGALNFSYFPQGRPTYKNRLITGNLFKSVTDKELEPLRMELCNVYHGREVHLWLPNDLTHYWVGAIQFGEISGYNSGKIPFSITAQPWKLKNAVTRVSFNVDGSGYATLKNEAKPVTPLVTASDSVIITVGDTVYPIAPNTPTQPRGFVLEKKENTVSITGTGTVSFEYQEGSL